MDYIDQTISGVDFFFFKYICLERSTGYMYHEVGMIYLSYLQTICSTIIPRLDCDVNIK